MLVTLESLLINDNINTNDTVIDMESLEFDITDTIMECSELSMDINTYESALTIYNNLQMEDNNDNIFKRFVEKIKKLLTRIKDFIKNVISTISNKINRHYNDKEFNTIIDKIQKSSESVFACEFNTMVTELYEQKLTIDQVNDFITTSDNYGTNCLKLLDQFRNDVANDSDTDGVMQEFEKEFDKLINSIKNNPIYKTISEFNEDSKSIWTKRTDFETEKLKISKDELIKRVEWCKDMRFNSDKLYDSYKLIDKMSKDFDDIQYIHDNNTTNYIKLVNSIVQHIRNSSYTVWTIFFHMYYEDIHNIKKLFD